MIPRYSVRPTTMPEPGGRVAYEIIETSDGGLFVIEVITSAREARDVVKAMNRQIRGC